MLENDNTQTTLRDVISSAVDEQAQAENVTQTDIARDEKGRFAPKTTEGDEVVTAQDVAQVQTEAVDNPQPTIKPRPSSWKKDYEEHWTKLDPTLQDYIAQRESDYARGVSQYKQNFEAVQPVYEALQPFMPLLQEHNIQPNQWIANLGNAHKTLALGSTEEKLQAFARLATEYGVPLNALTGQGYDPQQSLLMQELNQVKSQINEFKTLREQQEQMTLQQEIENFQKDAPYFEDVRETMAQLLQSGLASDLKSAYEKAIRFNDEVWQKQQAEAQQANAQAQAQQSQQKVVEAKAKAVSPKSISPTANMNNGNSKKDLRELLSESFDAVTASRV